MLEISGIKKSFDGTTVLNDISLKIGDSEIVSILGSSGGGKTTLLNIILGLLQPDSGSVVFNGNDITNTPMERRGFNIVFQDYALFPNLTAYKNIVYGLRNYPDRSSKEEIEALIDLLDLREHLNKKIDQLSGGQKQRVALARTMVMKPKILLLDEPLSAFTISDKVLILNKGKIEQFADPSEIIKNPKSQFVNDFILKQLEVKKNNIYKLFNL